MLHTLPLRLQAARVRLEKDHWYLKDAIFRVQFVEKPGLGTFAADIWWRMYYDPAVLEVWSVEETAGVLYHELVHLLDDHATRLKNIEPLLANYGADAAVNDWLVEKENIPLPGDPITPRKYGFPSGKMAEEYVRMFEKLFPPSSSPSTSPGTESGNDADTQNGRDGDATGTGGNSGEDDDASKKNGEDDDAEETGSQGPRADDRSESVGSSDENEGQGEPGDAGDSEGQGEPGDAGDSEGQGGPGGAGDSEGQDGLENAEDNEGEEASGDAGDSESQGELEDAGNEGGPGDAGDSEGEGGPGDAGDSESQGGPGDAGGGKNGKAKPTPGAGRCGSCATGRPEPWEDPAPDEGGPEGVSPIQAELIRRMVATKIQEASKTRGDVPGEWKRWSEEILRPKIDWRKELAAAIRSALSTVSGAVDYSRSVPSRRQSAYGRVIMPALRRPDPNVAVVVDTSASVSDEEVGRAIAETGGIIEAAGLREGVRVLSVDAEVHATQRVFRPDQIELYGGGGTNMARGIEAAERLRPQPDVIVVITDGYTPWPDTPPRKVKVIVVLTVRENEKFVPGWAKTIVVE